MNYKVVRTPKCLNYSDWKLWEDYQRQENDFLAGILNGLLNGEIVAARVTNGLRNWLATRSAKHKGEVQITCFDELMEPIADDRVRNVEDMWDCFPSSKCVYIIKR